MFLFVVVESQNVHCVRTAARGEPVFVGFLILERLIWVTATSVWVVKLHCAGQIYGSVSTAPLCEC